MNHDPFYREMTRREKKKFIESQARFFQRRRIQKHLHTLFQTARNKEQMQIAAEQASRVLMLSKKFRNAYLRWRAAKRSSPNQN